MSKVITIAQQKGGAGKTTVAAHLAVAMQQKGRRVAVVDIDPQGSLGYWHRVREQRFGEGYTGLTFASVSGWRVASEVARLRKNHDYIVIDSPPHTETEARTAIRAADMIIVPVQPSPTDLWATKATLDLAKAERIPVKILLNRVPPNSRLTSAIAGDLPMLADTTFGNRVIFAASLMEGRTCTELEPNCPASMEVKALVKEVLKQMEREEAPAAAKSKSKELADA
jgi:chromosome partitioning protein